MHPARQNKNRWQLSVPALTCMRQTANVNFPALVNAIGSDLTSAES